MKKYLSLIVFFLSSYVSHATEEYPYQVIALPSAAYEEFSASHPLVYMNRTWQQDELQKLAFDGAGDENAIVNYFMYCANASKESLGKLVTPDNVNSLYNTGVLLLEKKTSFVHSKFTPLPEAVIGRLSQEVKILDRYPHSLSLTIFSFLCGNKEYSEKYKKDAQLFLAEASILFVIRANSTSPQDILKEAKLAYTLWYLENRKENDLARRQTFIETLRALKNSEVYAAHKDWLTQAIEDFEQEKNKLEERIKQNKPKVPLDEEMKDPEQTFWQFLQNTSKEFIDNQMGF